MQRSGARGALAVAGVGVLAALAIIAGADAGLAQARSYHIAEVVIDAALAEDGTLSVTEQRTFAYSGTFFGAFYSLPLRDGQQVTGFSLTDSTGVSYKPGQCRQDGARQPGAYEISGSAREFVVTWCYATPAADTTRTFTLTYDVTGAGTSHADASQLYWQWVGTGWDVPTLSVTADLRLPESAAGLTAGEDLRIWGHGPLNGQVRQLEDGTIRTAVTDLAPNTFVELRVLMPPEVLAGASSDGRAVREAILAEENCLAVAANADRARARGETPAEDCNPSAARDGLVTAGLLLGLVLGGGAWTTIFFKHGREYSLPPGLADYERELPDDSPPALVDWLLNWGKTSDEALVGTILDLARQGKVTIHRELRNRDRLLLPDKTEEVTVIRKVADADQGFERDVQRLLFDRAGDGSGEVTDAELKSWVKTNRESAYSWWKTWTRHLEMAGKARGWIESRGWIAAGVVIGLVLMAAGIVAVVLTAGDGRLPPGSLLAAAGVSTLGGLVLIGLSVLMRRRTREGNLLHHRWERFGAYLTDFSLLPERGPEHLALWGHYLVYAVPLGVADQVMRNLDANLSAAEMDQVAGGWYPIGGYDGTPRGFSTGLASLSAAIPASTISSSPSSSGSGGGGGFSGGGGGGGGGSGGGAF